MKLLMMSFRQTPSAIINTRYVIFTGSLGTQYVLSQQRLVKKHTNKIKPLYN